MNIPTIGEKPSYDIKIPNIEIVGPRVLILPHKPREYRTDGGIVVPEHAQGQAQKGLVILTGDGAMLADGTKLAPRVQPGWEVIYARYAGVELELDGDMYLIVQESEIRCVLRYSGLHFTLNDEGGTMAEAS